MCNVGNYRINKQSFVSVLFNEPVNLLFDLYAKFLYEFVHDMKKEDIFPFIFFCHKNAINKKESSSDFFILFYCVVTVPPITSHLRIALPECSETSFQVKRNPSARSVSPCPVRGIKFFSRRETKLPRQVQSFPCTGSVNKFLDDISIRETRRETTRILEGPREIFRKHPRLFTDTSLRHSPRCHFDFLSRKSLAT